MDWPRMKRYPFRSSLAGCAEQGTVHLINRAWCAFPTDTQIKGGGMRKIFQQPWVPMLALWIGLGAIVHLTALEPVLAYVVGSLAALSTPFIALAIWRFDREPV
jgi:hypothetical protein